MGATWRLFLAEGKKLRGSSCLRMVWALPLLFALAQFSLFDYKLFGLKDIPAELMQVIDTAQIKMSGALWGGFFFPVLAALLPALIFRSEHRNKMWRHLGSMPVSPALVYAVKAIWVILLAVLSLAFVWLLFWVEQGILHYAAPRLQLRFHGWPIATVLGWLLLGSLPVISIYIWVSNRINSLAVPVVLGVVGILLSSALTSQEVPQPWKRDFIPWVTPNICVGQALVAADASKKTNLAGELFQEEADVIRLPSGKKIRTKQNVPDEVLFPPPPPTPPQALVSYSIVCCLVFLTLGGLDAGKCRK